MDFNFVEFGGNENTVNTIASAGGNHQQMKII